MTQAIPGGENTMPKQTELYLAFELSKREWKLAFSVGGNVRRTGVPARNLDALELSIAAAKERFRLSSATKVRSCYEAGRDGFWLHRWLLGRGIENVVVDSSSIQVDRRGRQVKTDRVDVGKLLALLVRYWRGERDAWSVLRIPTPEDEDQRRPHRELERLKKEETGHRVRIRSLLFLHGIDEPWREDLSERIATLRNAAGELVPLRVQAEIIREQERLLIVRKQYSQLRGERVARLKAPTDEAATRARQLVALVGIGGNSATVFTQELFGWRRFRNRREVAAAAGLTPTPYFSGDGGREQGIAKSGNRRVRRVLVQVAWGWLRYQPNSAISRWFQERFGHGQGRMRRVGIVALARKLLIALWRFVEDGVIPDGALFRANLKEAKW